MFLTWVHLSHCVLCWPPEAFGIHTGIRHEWLKTIWFCMSATQWQCEFQMLFTFSAVEKLCAILWCVCVDDAYAYLYMKKHQIRNRVIQNHMEMKYMQQQHKVFWERHAPIYGEYIDCTWLVSHSDDDIGCLPFERCQNNNKNGLSLWVSQSNKWIFLLQIFLIFEGVYGGCSCLFRTINLWFSCGWVSISFGSGQKSLCVLWISLAIASKTNRIDVCYAMNKFHRDSWVYSSIWESNIYLLYAASEPHNRVIFGSLFLTPTFTRYAVLFFV